MIYEVGDLARLMVAFKDIYGNLANPIMVTLIVQDPAGIQITYTSGIC